MSEDHLNQLMAESRERRLAQQAKKKRRIEMGYETGTVHPSGRVTVTTPKGIQNWYSTKELVAEVTTIFNRNEAAGFDRSCRINSKWTLQIRGKHLRRLLKAMPTVRQLGRNLVDTK